MKRINLAGLGFLFFLCLLAAGCSSNNSQPSTASSQPAGPASLQFTTPSSSPTIDAGQSVAVVVNQPVTWSLQAPNGRPVGALSQQTATGVTYSAPQPSQIFSPAQVTVIATLVSDSTQSAALGVVINPAVSIGGNVSGGNTSCQYDPISGIGHGTGIAGVAFGSASAPIFYLTAVGGTAPFTWGIASGTLPAGVSFGSAVTNEVSKAYIYGTPVSAGCSTVTFTVTDASGSSATSKTNYIIITPPPLSVQVPNYPDSYTSTPYPPFALSVSGGTPPYLNWSISNPSGVSLPPGMTLSPDTNNSASAVVSGTPNGYGNGCTPPALCTSNTPVVQVEDSQLPYPAYGTATLNIGQWDTVATSACSGQLGTTTNNSNLKGSYAFMLRGFDAAGPVVTAGSFSADGSGNITAGVEDVMRTSGSQTQASISGGSYALLEQTAYSTVSQGGCLTLTTSSGSTTFAISMGGCSTSSNALTGECVANSQGAAGVYTTGRLIEFDDNTGTGTRATGILRLQDNSAFSGGLAGLYAFGFAGWDSSGGRFAAAGSFSAGSSSLSSVAADINAGGIVQSALTGGTGTLGTVDESTGRGTASFTVGSSSFNNLVVYVVSAEESIVVNTGTPGPNNPVIGGEAISAVGPFSSASLQNTHMFRTGGLSGAGADANIGLLQFDGAGDFTGTQYEDQAGTLGTTALSGVYSVDSNTGRFALSAPTAGQNIGDHPLVGYVIPVSSTLTRQNCVVLASCVTGFLLSTDATAQFGQLEFQTPSLAPPPPFSNLYLTGYYFYGTDEALSASTPLFAGSSSVNPTGAKFTGIQSASYSNSSYCMQSGCSLLIPNEALDASSTYAVNSNGIASIGGETVAVTNGNVTFYIDESPTNAYPSVVVIEQ